MQVLRKCAERAHRHVGGSGVNRNAHGTQSTSDAAAVNAIAVSDHEAWSPIPRKCLRDLTRNPFRRRILCDVDPDEVSAVYPNDDECIEEVETDRRDDEEVHGGNLRRVIAQEGPPFLAGWSSPLDHVLGDARLRDLKPELEKFAVDARRAPKRVVHAHPPDQCALVRLDLRPTSRRARLPAPIMAKAGPVPTHERLGSDDCENLKD